LNKSGNIYGYALLFAVFRETELEKSGQKYGYALFFAVFRETEPEKSGKKNGYALSFAVFSKTKRGKIGLKIRLCRTLCRIYARLPTQKQGCRSTPVSKYHL